MSGAEEREYHFRGLNETRYASKLTCCGVKLWDLSCDNDHLRCSATTCCSIQCSGPPDIGSTSASGSALVSIRARIIIAMVHCIFASVLIFFIVFATTKNGVDGDTTKYRVCVVDGRGGFKRAGKYCPILDNADSKVECVIGLDRLDCLRRINKGTVDFSVFTAEDLVTATNSQVDVLITNELRFSKDQFAYDVVAIVNDESGIKSKYDLQDKRLCHPGYGYEDDWTRILANFLEATVVPKSCEESISLTENRIKASSKFFKAACKAGPWVSDDILDEKLKRKYSNLCDLCASPGRCSTNDKYWGRQGPLFCLTDGVGDVSWARLDDARLHFGLIPGAAAASPEGYSYLCSDGTKKPVSNTTTPCVWVSKPWPVIAAKRTSAQEVQGFINRLDHSDTKSWQHALLNLIESYHIDIHSVVPIKSIESYLLDTPGYLSANSFSGCHPPRSIRMCTTSNIERARCGWLREAAGAYGLEPDLQCVKADNKSHCLQAVQLGWADTVLVSPDLLMTARRDYALKTLFYEDVMPEDRYETVAVVRKDSTIRKFEDLRGKKACFPSFEGIAWNSMLYDFHHRGLLSYECPYSIKAAKYFGDSCAPGVPESAPESLRKLCKSGSYESDIGALKCFTLEKADVAFVSKSNLKKLVQGHLNSEKWVSKLMSEIPIVLCQDELKPCELSWSAIGETLIRASSTEMAFHETFDAFMQADALFGNDYKSLTRAFSMYGPFDGNHDVLFDDQTVALRGKQYMKRVEKSIPSYDDVLKDVSVCMIASASVASPYFAIVFSSIYVLVKFFYAVI